MDRQLDIAPAESQTELDEQISTELLRGDGFGAAEMAAIDAALAEARTLVRVCLGQDPRNHYLHLSSVRKHRHRQERHE
jgi:hypothetical protein